MGNVFVKVIGYVFLRYVIFFIVLYSLSENVKAIGFRDLKTGEDWFMLSWLFILPLLLELLIIGLPMGYGLKKLSNMSSRIPFYLLFVVLFIIEFLFANWLYGMQSAFIKVGISAILFLLLFWKRIF